MDYFLPTLESVQSSFCDAYLNHQMMAGWTHETAFTFPQFVDQIVKPKYYANMSDSEKESLDSFLKMRQTQGAFSSKGQS